MSVYKRRGSKNYFIQFMFDGKTYIKSSKSPNKKIAEQMEINWKADLHSKKHLGERPSITLKKALQNHLERSKGKIQTEKSIKFSIRLIEKHFDTSMNIDQLTTRQCELVYEKCKQEGRGLASTKKMFDTIRVSINSAKRLGYLHNEYLFLPKVPIPNHRIRWLSVEEENRLLYQLQPSTRMKGLAKPISTEDKMYRRMVDNYHLVILLLDTGARYSEISDINWRSIDLANRRIYLWRTKTQSETTIHMTDRAFKVLSERSKNRDPNSEYVFTDDKGTGPRGYSARAIRRCLDLAGLEDVKIHDLRHTAATRLIQNGLSLYEVSLILGHKNPNTTTKIYAHLATNDVAIKAADVLNKINEQANKLESAKPKLQLVK